MKLNENNNKKLNMKFFLCITVIKKFRFLNTNYKRSKNNL